MVLNGDKSVKRQIANSNERRRMQSINEGFQTLKKLLPQHLDKDKMSKVQFLFHWFNSLLLLFCNVLYS